MKAAGTLGDARALGRLAYVAYTFPVLTQTFTTREVAALRESGVDVVAHAARADPAAALDPEAGDEGARAQYLPRPLSRAVLAAAGGWLLRRPIRFLATLAGCLGGGYRDDAWRCRARAPLHFLLGCALATRLQRSGGYARIHAQMVDAGSTVAFVAARLHDQPFSFTNHTAYNPFLLPLKTRHAELVVSISAYDRDDVRRRVGSVAGRHEIVRVGIRLDEWTDLPRQPRSGRVLSVAALRPKKGHVDLVRAAARLAEQGVAVHVVIVGEGAERGRLEELIATLDAPVELLGATPPGRVREELARAAAFCLPCRVAPNGDLDGIPVALMEAMAAGVPCVSTTLSGIPELIEHGVSGLLVAPGDSAALAVALRHVLERPAEAARLAANGRRSVATRHDLTANAARLAGLLFPGTP